MIVSGAGEASCGSSVLNEYDPQNQNQHVTSASFVMKRVAAGTTCAQVRATSFP